MTTTGLISRYEARSLVLDGTDDTGYPARKDRWHQFLTALGDTEQYHAHSVRTWVAEHPPAGSVAPAAPDLRQAAIDDAVTAFRNCPAGPWLSDASGLESAIEDAVDAAFATVAEGLHIAPNRRGVPCVWTNDGLPLMVRSPVRPGDRLWALLAAVIPIREETP